MTKKRKGTIGASLDDMTGSASGVSMPAGEEAEKFVRGLYAKQEQRARAKKPRTKSLMTQYAQDPSKFRVDVGADTDIVTITDKSTGRKQTVKIESFERAQRRVR